MRARAVIRVLFLAAGVLAWGLAAGVVPALAARQDSAAGDDVPRMADGHPDLSGVWWGGADVGGNRGGGGRGGARGGGRGRGGARGAAPATFTSLYQPWAAEKAATLNDSDDPSLRCISTAFGTLNVRLWDVGAVGQIISTPGFVVLLTETYHSYQVVPTDGRPHRSFVPPSYRGDPVGHWEGDTFVVETTNFTCDTWMSAEGRVSFHSDSLRIVERYQRLDANTLQIDAVVEDPEVLTGPWTVPTQTLVLAPFDQLLPLNCVGAETTDLMEAAFPDGSN
jgi:hypothetical protein